MELSVRYMKRSDSFQPVDEGTRERWKRKNQTKKEGGREREMGPKNERRKWSAIWKYKVGCKDCEFWGFCSFTSFFSVLVYEKIHRLNGLVYYFLYLGRSLCESPAKKLATSHPLLVSSAFSLSSILSSFLPFTFFLMYINRKIYLATYTLKYFMSSLSVFVFFLLWKWTINHKLMYVRLRMVV